jgi:ribosomal-protein-alanine N-acetyltransferase
MSDVCAVAISGFEPIDADAVLRIARDAGVTLDLEGERARAFARIWVARRSDTGETIGFALAWFVADEVHVIDIATCPTFRRRGAGKALLRAMLVEVGSQRARLVLLEVRRSNAAARRLYRSHGFRVLRIRSGYYDQGSEDAIEMGIFFDENGDAIPGQDETSEDEVGGRSKSAD